MYVLSQCPKCAGQLRLAESSLGQTVRCPRCGHPFRAEAPAPPAPPAPAAVEQIQAAPPSPVPVITVLGQLPPPREPRRSPGPGLWLAALTPLGLMGAAFVSLLWGAVGVVLTAACLAVVLQRRWSPRLRLSLALGCAGTGYLALIAAILFGGTGSSAADVPPALALMGRGIPDVDSTLWQECVADDSSFSTWLPGHAQKTPAPLAKDLPVFMGSAFSVRCGERAAFSVHSCGLLPLAFIKKTGQQAFEETVAAVRRASPGEVLSQREILLDGIYPGKEVVVRDAEEGVTVERFYLTEYRLSYRLYVLRVRGASAKDGQRFFNSFRLTTDAFPPTPPPAAPAEGNPLVRSGFRRDRGRLAEAAPAHRRSTSGRVEAGRNDRAVPGRRGGPRTRCRVHHGAQRLSQALFLSGLRFPGQLLNRGGRLPGRSGRQARLAARGSLEATGSERRGPAARG